MDETVLNGNGKNLIGIVVVISSTYYIFLDRYMLRKIYKTYDQKNFTNPFYDQIRVTWMSKLTNASSEI